MNPGRSTTQRGSESIDKETLCLLQDLRISPLVGFAGHFPIVDTPPPLSNSGTHTPAPKLGASIPEAPAEHSQIPENALGQREKHLITNGDKGNFPVGFSILDTGEVGLLKAKVGDRGQISAARARADDLAGNG